MLVVWRNPGIDVALGISFSVVACLIVPEIPPKANEQFPVPAPPKLLLATLTAPLIDHVEPLNFSLVAENGPVIPAKADAAFCVPEPDTSLLAVTRGPLTDHVVPLNFSVTLLVIGVCPPKLKAEF
jgi:hypothetical protein